MLGTSRCTRRMHRVAQGTSRCQCYSHFVKNYSQDFHRPRIAHLIPVRTGSLQLNSSQIEEIGLADNGLHEEFGEKLCEFLKVLRTRDYIFYLKKFDLTGNGIAPDGLEAVNKELRKNQLQQLDHDKPRQEKELKVQRIAYKRRNRIAEK